MIYLPIVKENVEEVGGIHYDSKPMKYTVIFHGCESNNFQMKNCGIFHIFAQNIDCVYTLEPLHRGGSNEYPP